MKKIYTIGIVGMVLLVLTSAMAAAALCENDTFGVYNDNDTTKLEESGQGKLTEAEEEYYKSIKKLKWAGPEGTAPTSYEEWREKFPTPISGRISPIPTPTPKTCTQRFHVVDKFNADVAGVTIEVIGGNEEIPTKTVVTNSSGHASMVLERGRVYMAASSEEDVGTGGATFTACTVDAVVIRLTEMPPIPNEKIYFEIISRGEKPVTVNMISELEAISVINVSVSGPFATGYANQSVIEKVRKLPWVEVAATPVPVSLNDTNINQIAKEEKIYFEIISSGEKTITAGMTAELEAIGVINVSVSGPFATGYANQSVIEKVRKLPWVEVAATPVSASLNDTNTNQAVQEEIITSKMKTPEFAKYVIITTTDLSNEFQVLADQKTKKGVTAKVVTVSWIISNYAGRDTQEKIRNFIKDAHMNWGTKWILLGGDTNLVPHRLAYGKVGSYPAELIPTDLYYSDLDGTWDANNNDIFGEVADNVDLYPDVYVGRAPVGTNSEAQSFVAKTLRYEKDHAVCYQTKILFLAEYLDLETDGGIAKDIIENNYISSPPFTITKKYERLGNLNRTLAIENLNQGYGIVNHVGHANFNVLSVGPDYLWNSDMDSLTNAPRYLILYSIGCWSNALDYDSIAEHFVLNPCGGGVAYVGNSRYGWYYRGAPGYGTSDRYDQQFFNSLLNEGFYNIGEAVADSKEYYIPWSQIDGSMRWVQYALNLLGDPELNGFCID